MAFGAVGAEVGWQAEMVVAAAVAVAAAPVAVERHSWHADQCRQHSADPSRPTDRPPRWPRRVAGSDRMECA